MIKENVKLVELSQIGFIRLYCAMIFKNKLLPVINHHELEKQLYPFYHLPEFKDLFQDICPKKDAIYPEESYLDLGEAFQTAQLFGLIIPVYAVGETRSVICCDEDIAQEIISTTDKKMVNKMANLFHIMFCLEDSNEKNENTRSNMNHNLTLVKKMNPYSEMN